MAEDEQPRKEFLKEIAKEASSYRWLCQWNRFAFERTPACRLYGDGLPERLVRRRRCISEGGSASFEFFPAIKIVRKARVRGSMHSVAASGMPTTLRVVCARPRKILEACATGAFGACLDSCVAALMYMGGQP
jgi:hypothetical protein